MPVMGADAPGAGARNTSPCRYPNMTEVFTRQAASANAFGSMSFATYPVTAAVNGSEPGFLRGTA